MWKINHAWRRLRRWAADYEPAKAAALAAAFMEILVAAGIHIGGFPKVVDGVLAFLAVAAPIVAGKAVRRRVWSERGAQRLETEAWHRGFRQGRHVR